MCIGRGRTWGGLLGGCVGGCMHGLFFAVVCNFDSVLFLDWEDSDGAPELKTQQLRSVIVVSA